MGDSVGVYFFVQDLCVGTCDFVCFSEKHVSGQKSV